MLRPQPDSSVNTFTNMEIVMQLDKIESTLETIESPLKRIDDANKALADAEKELGEKSFLDVLKAARRDLHEHWHGFATGKALFGPDADPVEQKKTRDLVDRVDLLIKRLTPAKWSNGVRIEPHQTTYKLGSRS